MYRDPITTDDVLSGPMVAEDRVPDLVRPPVRGLGPGTAVSHTAMSEWVDFTVSPAAVSGRLAFGRACARTTSSSRRSTTRSRT